MKYKSNILSCTAFFILFVNLTFAQSPQEKLIEIFNPKHQNILVAAHRGDWRNTPENSVQALLNSIAKGFDIMELDVKMSKDSQLVVMHDDKIDRTTNGKGKVSDFTLAELKMFRLKNGLGRLTLHQIPTFLEMMQVAKDKILINVDKGDDNLATVFDILQQTGTLKQAVVNFSENEVYKKLNEGNKIPKDAFLMLVVDMKKPTALATIEQYKVKPNVIIQPIFDADTFANLNELPKIALNQVLWINSLWPSLNGGHDDDTAVEEVRPKESWGWIIAKKAKVIQTDRPLELLIYLKKNGLHN